MAITPARKKAIEKVQAKAIKNMGTRARAAKQQREIAAIRKKNTNKANKR